MVAGASDLARRCRPDPHVGDLARATYESMTYAIACDLARLDTLAPGRGLPVLFAGGGSRSTFAAQMLADVSGRSVEVPELANATALGGARLVAGAAPPPEAMPAAPALRAGRRDAHAYRPSSSATATPSRACEGVRRHPERRRPRVRPLLLTADLTPSARSAITDELGYTIVDRRACRARGRAPRRRRRRRGRLAARGRPVRRGRARGAARPALDRVCAGRPGQRRHRRGDRARHPGAVRAGAQRRGRRRLRDRPDRLPDPAHRADEPADAHRRADRAARRSRCAIAPTSSGDRPTRRHRSPTTCIAAASSRP